MLGTHVGSLVGELRSCMLCRKTEKGKKNTPHKPYRSLKKERGTKKKNKLKIDLPYDLAISSLHIYLRKTKALIQKDNCTSVLIAALSTKAEKQLK